MGTQYRVTPYYIRDHELGAITKEEASRRLQRAPSLSVYGAKGKTYLEPAVESMQTAKSPSVATKSGASLGSAHQAASQRGGSAAASSHSLHPHEFGAAAKSHSPPPETSEKGTQMSPPPKSLAPTRKEAGAQTSPQAEAAVQVGSGEKERPPSEVLAALEDHDQKREGLASDPDVHSGGETSASPTDDASSVSSEEETRSPYASEATLRKALHAHCMKRKDLTPKVEFCLRNMLEAHRTKAIPWHKRPRRFLGSLNRPKTELCHFDLCELTALSEQTAIREEPDEHGESLLIVDDPRVCLDAKRANILEEDSCAGIINLSLELTEFAVGGTIFLSRNAVHLSKHVFSSFPSIMTRKILDVSSSSIYKAYRLVFGRKESLSHLSESDLRELQLKILEGNNHNLQAALNDVKASNHLRLNKVDSEILAGLKRSRAHIDAYFTGAKMLLLPTIEAFLIKILPSLVNVYGSGVEVALTFVSVLLPKWEISGCKVGRYDVKGWFVFAPSLALSIFMGFYLQTSVSALLALSQKVASASIFSAAVQSALKDFNVVTNDNLTSLVSSTNVLLTMIQDKVEITSQWVQSNFTNTVISGFFEYLNINFKYLYDSILGIIKQGYKPFQKWFPSKFPRSNIWNKQSFSSEESSSFLEKALEPFKEESVEEQEVVHLWQDAKDSAWNASKRLSGAVDQLFSTNMTGSLAEIEAAAKKSEVITSFSFKFIAKFAKLYDISIQNKKVESIDEWIVSFVRSFIVSLLHFLFECVSDMILCRVAKFFWSHHADYLMS